MKTLAGILLAFAALAPMRGEAMVIGGVPEAQHATDVITVAGRCGRYAHYVPGHRTRMGNWVRGHCVRNYGRPYR